MALCALFDDQLSSESMATFVRWRHQLRHGQHLQVLTVITGLINSDVLTGKNLLTLIQVQAYFQRHHRHIRYQQFEQQQIPLGSGLIESTCKWLIQQRFKGVGMLRGVKLDSIIYWLFGSLGLMNAGDDLFPTVSLSAQTYSPKL